MGYNLVSTGPVSDQGMPSEPEMGFAAYFNDCEGNLMGLWQSAT
jgi:predicted enzyme related to lactoylglutathione lyase